MTTLMNHLFLWEKVVFLYSDILVISLYLRNYKRRMFIRLFKKILFVGLLSILSILLFSKNSYGQALLWIDSYKIRPVIGVRFSPKQKVINGKRIFVGPMGGISITSSEKRLGLNLRINYMYPIILTKDSTTENILPVYVSYLELTYKILLFSNTCTKVSLGIAKPSYKLNPYFGCPYCFMYNATISIQQQIKRFNFELRIDAPIGDNYVGWQFTGTKYMFYTLGFNYTFPLSKKKEKPKVS